MRSIEVIERELEDAKNDLWSRQDEAARLERELASINGQCDLMRRHVEALNEELKGAMAVAENAELKNRIMELETALAMRDEV